ncbi:hypothetical protein BOTBODRAFT_30311 [Botryobasidium botryosum FD-172 SS1]|uniref:DNA-directed RNA polymerase I subunit RPA49 n=1 Tax=Botryobasidium botryosum (strain FD-172 SS1) TaxID=930990 RepID=A0A067MN17_BOTB1|nr:hypothetical protein BOTBODRAFT_30311 [Botryobasidium botryosum FD-172 SS1]
MDASKKRKRGAESAGSGTLKISVAEHRKSQIGPVIASFPSVQPPTETPFQCYRDATAPQEPVDLTKQTTILAGQTDTVAFVSSDHQPSSKEAAYSCQYMIGVYDRSTNSVVLRHAPAYVMAREVKSLKATNPAAVSNLQRLQARNALGETFGTKKAKAAIRAAERNKVDVSAMEGVVGHLQDSIDANTVSLPTQEQAKATVDSHRPIPPVNIAAQTPSEVYNINDIALENELDAAPVSSLISRERNVLPYWRSKWLNAHLEKILAAKKPSKKKLKLVFFISSMLAFKDARVGDKAALQKKLERVPSIILDGLLARFTETSRGSAKSTMTEDSRTRLLTHMFALCLKLDDYATEIAVIAADLQMPQTQISQLFKALGCTVETYSKAERERLKMSLAEARENRKARLKIPLVFPKAKSGPARR